MRFRESQLVSNVAWESISDATRHAPNAFTKHSNYLVEALVADVAVSADYKSVNGSYLK